MAAPPKRHKCPPNSLNPCSAIPEQAVETVSRAPEEQSSSSILETGRPRYNSFKAGVKQLARPLAAEWAPHGIRVSSISSGYMDTALNKANGLEQQKRIWLSPLASAMTSNFHQMLTRRASTIKGRPEARKVRTFAANLYQLQNNIAIFVVYCSRNYGHSAIS